MTRRHFLRTSAATATLAGTSSTLLALDKDNVYRKKIGIQLYTLRNEIGKDTPGTIKAVKEAGYVQGEMYGFPNCDPMIAAAKAVGLELHSSHFDWEAVVNPRDAAMSDFQGILEKAGKTGLSHLVIPYLHNKDRGTLDDYKRTAENCNKGAALAKKAGIQLAYHNHAFEFEPKEGGRTGYDVFIKEFSPEMQFEIDVFWVVVGGVDPIKLMKKLKGRVSQLHLKDLKKGSKTPDFGGLPKESFKELGNGMIDMEPIIVAARDAGVAHCHVEQDHSPNPLESIVQSMKYLKGL
jgi:sugar phosphate isomerase/epimerase